MPKRRGKSGRRISKEIYVFIALIAVSFALLVFSTRSLMANFKDAGLSVFSGARSGIHEITSFVSGTILSISELSRLRQEHSELLERITRYEQLERSAAEIIQENNRLREQLGFSQESEYRHIPAELIGRDPDNLFSALVINKGQSSGISRDMAVIAFQGGVQALVGKVIQARTYESLVMPLYDANLLASSRFAISRYEGIVEGQGSPDAPLRMRFIPKRARDEINAGDLVVSSGLGGIYPPGINIGRVSNVSLREYEITLEAELEPIIDFSRLEYVFIIKKNERNSFSGSTFPEETLPEETLNEEIFPKEIFHEETLTEEISAEESFSQEPPYQEHIND
ncbi:MAG: rod shape-determining protein MreC [Treponema sp.]|nr:rod shape-determining protein MreC [Treponema sp.]